MSNGAEKTTLKVTDIEAVSEKLDKFAAQLPAQEQEVLGWILARARAAGDPGVPVAPVVDEPGTAAHGLAAAPRAPALSSSLARAAGLRPSAAESEITVSWKHKFGREALDTRINPGRIDTGR